MQIKRRVTSGRRGRTYVVVKEDGGTSWMKVLETRDIIDVAINDDPLASTMLLSIFCSIAGLKRATHQVVWCVMLDPKK